MRYAMLLSLLLLVGCDDRGGHEGPSQHDSVSIDLNAVQRADVDISLGAGELNLTGGSSKLLDGDLLYRSPNPAPNVESHVNGTHAAITISERDNSVHQHGGHISWNLRMNDTVLTDLNVSCGAGHANMKLGDVPLRRMKVSMGAGQVELDLRGEPKHSYDVEVSGGVGQAVIQLPSGVGLFAEAHGGLGSIDVSGLEKKGDHYENASYDSAKTVVHLKVNGGIGQIRIIG